MRAKYAVRQLVKTDFGAAAGMRYAVYEFMSDFAQPVGLFYEKEQAHRVCRALQRFAESGTKPLNGTPIFAAPAPDDTPQQAVVSGTVLPFRDKDG